MTRTKTTKRKAAKKTYCRHAWVLESHWGFYDGEYWTCEKCGKTKFR